VDPADDVVEGIACSETEKYRIQTYYTGCLDSCTVDSENLVIYTLLDTCLPGDAAGGSAKWFSDGSILAE